jgi:hypothetical protein
MASCGNSRVFTFKQDFGFFKLYYKHAETHKDTILSVKNASKYSIIEIF